MSRREVSGQYARQLKRLETSGKEATCIMSAVEDTLSKLSEGAKSFVIYGEPQSGKTEMMICLTARLLDSGYTFILHLLNDSVDLLQQNLGRFRESGLAPSARNFTEILDRTVAIKNQPFVVFCKKNGSDLKKLIERLDGLADIIVIDDEADFASPNAKVNKGEKTRINEQIETVLGVSGVYIGVTATPARLDLNNTFENESERWVNFSTHSKYTGQDVFFPLDAERAPAYRRTLLPDKGDEPHYVREALFRFFVSVAALNGREGCREENYSILVHTSGKTDDHKSDRATIQDAIGQLLDPGSCHYEKYVEYIWTHAAKYYPSADADALTQYVLTNLRRLSLVVLNSKRDWKDNSRAATDPVSLFTIIIGGNIVSRGVTLNNLLSMFFTRDAKHKIQQDTYIQRARMFGSRGDYLKHFELSIPRSLYFDWHRCFAYHRLALASIREGQGALVWLSDKRISAVSNPSIDRARVDLDRGEMSFQLFTFANDIEDLLLREDVDTWTRLELLAERVGEASFPTYVRRFIQESSRGREKLVKIHSSSSIASYRDGPGISKKTVTRSKGFFGRSQLGTGGAEHHVKIFHNAGKEARIFYKFGGKVSFIKNTARG